MSRYEAGELSNELMDACFGTIAIDTKLFKDSP